MESFDFDNETSSDDEYTENFPYNLNKNGREYIFIRIDSSNYLAVPSYEFEKVYGKELDVLRSRCKNISDMDGVKLYKFQFHYPSINMDGIKWIPKYEYIYNDMELHEICGKIEDIIHKYAKYMDNKCDKEDKSWYAESTNKPNDCLIKEYFDFSYAYISDDPSGYKKVEN
jgi:hypothetical protein